nr:hypothetical protein [Tanacetum cinerariifolium]
MAALVISVSSNVSVESAESSFPRVILIGPISIEVPVAPKVGAALVASSAGVLELDTHSSPKADPSEKSDIEILERHVSPTPHEDMLTRWRSRIALRSSSPTTSILEIPTALILPAPSAIVAPSSEFPLAPVVSLSGIHRRRAILIRPEEDIPIGRLYRTHPGRPCRASTMRKSVNHYLLKTKLTYGVAYTKLILRVKKLEHKVKTCQHRRKARVVLSDDEEDSEDPSKQGRKIAEIDVNPSISLVQDEGTLWIQEDFKIQGRTSADTVILLDQEEPTELVEDLGSGEKGEKEISTVILKKKSKMQLEQERLRHKEAIRLQEQIFEEERQRIVRDTKIAKQLQEAIAEADSAHDIDWNDPADVTEEEATSAYEKEKEELRLSLKIIYNDDSEVNYEPLSRKFPVERFPDHPLEGHDLLLWGDLRMIFDPDKNDELWMNQLDWKLLRWKMHENCKVDTMFMDGALMEINMLVEKKYPLIKELLKKTLNSQLKAEEESTMAFELIKFIKSLLKEKVSTAKEIKANKDVD